MFTFYIAIGLGLIWTALWFFVESHHRAALNIFCSIVVVGTIAGMSLTRL